MKSDVNKNKKQTNILIVGQVPPPIGGTTVLLQCLIKSLCKNPGVCLQLLETGVGKGNLAQRCLRIAQFVFRMIRIIPKVDVVTLHCSTISLPFVGAVILLLSRLFCKPVIIRKFAGTDYRYFGFWRGKLSEYVLSHVNLYLAETQNLVTQATERGLSNVRWFPNHRPFQFSSIDNPWLENKTTCKRFIYVGQVREYKGIRILAEAAKKLPEGVTVDVYGPWFDDLDRHIFDNIPNIRYRGVLEPDEVSPTMQEYDALVFPTHHDGEGYPGVIFEAYGVGLPIITTRWLALPEIVDDSVGIFVEPKNIDDLCKAMTRLSQEDQLFQQLRSNTREKAELFSAERWADEFVTFCTALSEKKI